MLVNNDQLHIQVKKTLRIWERSMLRNIWSNHSLWSILAVADLVQIGESSTRSVPIYRRYSFLKKILKYKTPAKFGERFVGFVDIFHKQIWSGVRGDQEFPYFPLFSHLKARKIKCLTCALIFVQKTIPPIYRNGGSMRFSESINSSSIVTYWSTVYHNDPK
jgi:hypothetical protein